MNQTFKILIVDDHPLVIMATKELLAEMPGIQVVGSAGTGRKCLELITTLEPDIVLLDFQLPDQFGDEVAKLIKEINPQIHVIIFTGIDITDLFNHFMELKVSGIVSKESSREFIQEVIRNIMKNQVVLPLSMFHQMRFIKHIKQELLTEDEVQIMSFVVKGVTNEQIAGHIHMSRRSVDNYLKKIYGKFGVKSRAQAIEKFVEGKKSY